MDDDAFADHRSPLSSRAVARTLDIDGVPVKLRSPWGAFILALITFGIYYVVWYFRTNKELRDASGISVSPGIAVVAITFGWLILVPPFVSQWRFYQHIQAAQERAGMDHVISHVTGFVLFLAALVLLPFEIPYAQHHLNRLWQFRAGELEKRAMGMRAGSSQTF